MMYVILVVSLVGLACAATTPAPIECMNDGECSPLECCYKKHELLVVSKRGGTFEGYPFQNQDLSHVKGVCQRYHQVGDACSPYDKRNGFCSCNVKMGHSCQMVTDPNPDVDVIPTSRFQCVDELLASRK
ncbi:uncharacterized protein LOC127866151 [Dreissena polymorpha]|uniref:Uncharacterized protein n=1 Tax=Dreissena polymorpha TaxID=45954 RepID=A0A9D4LNI3_DREPO|nr:uncharacterized protein LOC127866151 [Dreissena polymorpha]KAH3862042.1 hypothetical protein DPMN_024998 [Dreissena polymorpha]